VQIKRMNWFKRPTQWETAQSRRNQNQAVTQQFINNTAAASAAMLGAQNNLTNGMVDLTTQAAVQRLRAQPRTQSIDRAV
jgi:hypothetical protein